MNCITAVNTCPIHPVGSYILELRKVKLFLAVFDVYVVFTLNQSDVH